MIELEHVTKTYRTTKGPHVVLDDVSLRFHAGEGIGVLGRNGAGKSTLLRIIGGAEAPTSGRVRRTSRVSWPIGFAGAFHGSLSGEANCRFVARIYAQDIDRVVDETRAFAEIGEYFFMPVRTYSSGMRARLAFGLSMAIDFDVYLIDEITAVGDKPFRKKCGEALEERRARAGLVLVSHDLAMIRRHCTRCLVVSRGALSDYDDVDEALKVYDQSLSA
ncbi:MAG: ABC transporter ATP-binding protein [Deltaproteobacteria bacterium]|nr:ABC transporter ATP-binding protein [Deltaproteobacteria bacterium]